MGYEAISANEAREIIYKLKSEKIIKREIIEGSTATRNINKEEAQNLIKQATKIYMNDDEYVRNICLFFGETSDVEGALLDEKYVCLMFAS